MDTEWYVSFINEMEKSLEILFLHKWTGYTCVFIPQNVMHNQDLFQYCSLFDILKTTSSMPCKPGYFGVSCLSPCPLGRFGENCGGECSPICSKELCNSIFGCLNSTTDLLQTNFTGKYEYYFHLLTFF